MNDLLFLAHRIPYPPNKGDKIRSYHLLRGLASRYRVHLAAFVDDEDDFRHRGVLEALCADCLLVPLRPWSAKVRGGIGALRGDALSVGYFRDRRIAAWVARAIAAGVRRSVAFSSPMAQYVIDAAPDLRNVVDMVDVDSDKWRQYAEKKSWPLSWIYRRESVALLDYERRVAERASATVFVSEAEAGLFRRLASGAADRVTYVENGVDTDYFRPDGNIDDPYQEGGAKIVFTGAMDYWANVDAVTWFVDHVLPGVHRGHPTARFVIVGSNPPPAVRRLAQRPGVDVTGRVPDVRPYLAHADLSVAPLRIARGIQNKVLEAMAMARPVIASPEAIDGLVLSHDATPVVAHEPDGWIAAVDRALSGAYPVDPRRLRGEVEQRYSWEGRCEKLERLIEA